MQGKEATWDLSAQAALALPTGSVGSEGAYQPVVWVMELKLTTFLEKTKHG